LVDILVSDRRTLYRPHVDAHQMHLEPHGSLAAGRRQGADVVYITGVLPIMRHLFVAALFRARGARIVFAPMVFLTEEFASRSWTHPRPRWWSTSKPLARLILKSAWSGLAHAFVCQSQHEVMATGLDPAKCVVLPWPKPDVPLLIASGVGNARPPRDLKGLSLLSAGWTVGARAWTDCARG
jgi:hypothetical protein